jgi:hypothetical protein
MYFSWCMMWFLVLAVVAPWQCSVYCYVCYLCMQICGKPSAFFLCLRYSNKNSEFHFDFWPSRYSVASSSCAGFLGISDYFVCIFGIGMLKNLRWFVILCNIRTC